MKQSSTDASRAVSRKPPGATPLLVQELKTNTQLTREIHTLTEELHEQVIGQPTRSATPDLVQTSMGTSST